ncbi:head-tail adaptor protein [Marivita sp. GX14005]|uniref:head-tail adaptor protein n=1 Tax=Marivita sp. GX14005 TaxID=2942276 RepID=UPI00201935C1|nr:head-tail adaptor protein [Marivita sp. GX14005]MCL3883711.1 head-tail adaptor protein [Marivita sp. GX14005]
MSVRLTAKLVLERLEAVPDGAGGMRESWVELGVLWGEVTPRTGRETRGEAGQVSVAGFRIVVRGQPQGHSARPLPEQRFRQGGRVFRINSVTEADAGGRYLVCFCEEEVAT